MATTYLNRTLTAGNRKTYTYSLWLKRSKLAANISVFSAARGDVLFRFGTSDDLQFRDINNSTFNLSTNNVFRDVSAFYHFVIAVDTTQATASNRIKLYVNGTQQTSDFGTETYPSQNLDTDQNNNGDTMYVGTRTDSGGSLVTSQILDGYISQFIFADGTAYDASTFGSTNANGVWVPNTSPSVTYGTNGFKLDFAGTGATANSSGFGADTSGNDNHFTSNSLGTNPSVKDTPHNVFATLQETNAYASPVIGQGGLEFDSNSSGGSALPSTMAVSSGKWYAEFKVTAGGTMAMGVSDIGSESFRTGSTGNNAINYVYGGQIMRNGSNVQTSLATFTTNDIIGIALNMDTTSGNVSFTKNGVAVGSAQDFTSKPNFAGFYVQTHTSGGSQKGQFNFGQPVFTIASGNADANGHGNFEYSVPSGYYALCTKNLAQYGG